MARFLIVGTMLRGALEVPEALDATGQAMASACLEVEEAARKTSPRRERMSVTAADVAWMRSVQKSGER